MSRTRVPSGPHDLRLEAVRQDRKLISAWLEAGALLSVRENEVDLGFPPDQSFAKDFLEGSHLSFLEDVASRLLGRKARVRLQIREGVTASPVPVVPDAMPQPSPL